MAKKKPEPHPDLVLARESAARAQGRDDVADMIRSGDYDEWPNVKGALLAIQAVRQQAA